MCGPSSNHHRNSGLGSLFFVLLLGLSSLVAGCSRPISEHAEVISGSTMGTYYRISLSAVEQLDTEELQADIESILDRVNQSMSTYIVDSEVNRFSRSKANQPFKLSDDLYRVVTAAMSVSQLSDGFFDPTIGPIVRLWGFGPDQAQTFPEDQEIEARLSIVGYQNLSLTGQNLQKLHDDVELDLSAIAKGYVIDQIADYLHKSAMRDWLIDIGGELRASGNKAGQPWQVAIEIPHSQGGVQEIVSLRDQSIATSGDYRNYREVDGQRYSHAINPKTGYPVNDPLASVTVQHSSAMMADAHATAMLILGEQGALRYAHENELSAFLISRDSMGVFHIKMTGKFLSLED